jgi:hypothetical protein
MTPSSQVLVDEFQTTIHADSTGGSAARKKVCDVVHNPLCGLILRLQELDSNKAGCIIDE